MITSDYQAVLHFGKKSTKPKHLSLPLPPSFPPHFQAREKKKKIIFWWILELAPTFMLVALMCNRKFIYNSQTYSYALVPRVQRASENSFEANKIPSGMMWAASRRCRNVQHSTSIFIFISVCGIFIFIHCIFIMICFLIQNIHIFNQNFVFQLLIKKH